MRLLIVDNQRTIPIALSRLLTPRGFSPSVAFSGRESLELIRNHSFDLMLLEFRVPDMRGDEILRKAVTMRRHLGTRTLFMTGDYSRQGLGLIENTGRPYLLKPFEIAILVHELHHLAGGEPPTTEHERRTA